jgi:aldehyde dehydrogenase (NAD+)
VNNPATDELVGNINLARETEVDAAVSSARAAFESGPWSSFTGAQRAAVMLKVEVEAMGQPSAIAGGFVVPACAATWRHYAGWADKIEGQTFPEEGGRWRYTQYEPFGVCAGIGPWNVTIS